MPVELVEEDAAGPLEYSDMPWWGSDALTLRPAAVEVLGAVLQPIGELLPLSCRDASMVLFNVMNVVDALDRKASRIALFPNSERVMAIDRHVFRPEALVGQLLFKIPELTRGPIYASEELRDLVMSAALRGLEFRPIWNDHRPADTASPGEDARLAME